MARLGVAQAFVDGVLVPGDVRVTDGVLTEIGLPPARSGTAIAGLVDLHVNGYAGVDFLSNGADGWRFAAAALAANGTTSYVASIITSSERDRVSALRAAQQILHEPRGTSARLLGMHLEGPFLSPDRAGVHPVAHLESPDSASVDRWLSSGPLVAMTIAPELPGAIALIADLSSRGMLLSLGHSTATADEAHVGFDAGARSVTHIFNAMSGPQSRDAGLAGVSLVRNDVTVMMICDGVHLSDDVARLVLSSCAGRVVFVSDSVAGAGRASGRSNLGGTIVDVVNGRATREDGTLAGGVTALAASLKHATRLGATLEDAIAAVTERPARLVGRADVGVLRRGHTCDIVVLDDDLDVRDVHLFGR